MPKVFKTVACTTSSTETLPRLKKELVRFAGKDVMGFCGTAVGKVVTSLGRNFGLYTASTTRSLIVIKNVFIMHSLVTFFKQPLIVYTQLFLGYFKELRVGFYTLTTGPTNTTNLNKGIIL